MATYFPCPSASLFPSLRLLNTLFIAISRIYQFQLKNSHDFGNGRARCLPFANATRFLYLFLALSLSLWLSVYLSVRLSVCHWVGMCVQVEWKRHSPKITFPSLDYSALHFVKPKRRSSIGLKCPKKLATKTRSTYPTLHQPLQTPPPSLRCILVCPLSCLFEFSQ